MFLASVTFVCESDGILFDIRTTSMHRSLASRSALALLFALAVAGGAAAQQAPDAAP
ncbi:lytic murein transglycosylase, partial [Rhizobium sp. PRIMUS64]|nr:lytic murein transglycosylase [Rhizobium sp. PRIMUS64]